MPADSWLPLMGVVWWRLLCSNQATIISRLAVLSPRREKPIIRIRSAKLEPLGSFARFVRKDPVEYSSGHLVDQGNDQAIAR